VQFTTADGQRVEFEANETAENRSKFIVLALGIFLVTMGVLGRRQARRAQREGREIAKSYEREITVPEPVVDVFSRLQQALHGTSGIRDVQIIGDSAQALRSRPAAGALAARWGVSVWSWGEIMTCWVWQTGEQSVVHVRSESTIRTTLVDYGKNRRNVETILRKLGTDGR
jgi:hypothetical protein